MSIDPRIRVVIADDHEVVRAGIAAVISADEQIEVVGEASDGVGAVDTARLYDADVVLMDISMPGGDGLTSLLTMRRELPSVAVIMLTTFNVDEHISHALRAGAAGYLLKTAPTLEITAAIHAAYRGERALSQQVQDRLIASFLQQTPGDPPEELAELTEREASVFAELARGKSNSEIAAALFLSEATVKTYVTRILAKLGLRDRVQAVVFALKHGFLADDS